MLKKCSLRSFFLYLTLLNFGGSFIVPQRLEASPYQLVGNMLSWVDPKGKILFRFALSTAAAVGITKLYDRTRHKVQRFLTKHRRIICFGTAWMLTGPLCDYMFASSRPKN